MLFSRSSVKHRTARQRKYRQGLPKACLALLSLGPARRRCPPLPRLGSPLSVIS